MTTTVEDVTTDTDTLTEALKQTVKTPVPPAESTQDGPADEAEGDGPAEEEASTEDATAEGDDGPATRDDGKPFTRKDHTALRDSLKAARKEAREATAELAKARQATDGKDVAEVVAEADTRAEAKFKPLMVKAAARAAFVESGLVLPAGRESEVLARAIRLLDADALTISDEGNVVGLDEQVASVRDDFPDLFAQARRSTPRVAAADRSSSPTPPKGAAARLAEGLIGR